MKIIDVSMWLKLTMLALIFWILIMVSLICEGYGI